MVEKSQANVSDESAIPAYTVLNGIGLHRRTALLIYLHTAAAAAAARAGVDVMQSDRHGNR